GFEIASLGIEVTLGSPAAIDVLGALAARHLDAEPPAGSGESPRYAAHLAVLAYLAARSGEHALARDWASRVESLVDVGSFPAVRQLLALVATLGLSADGEHEAAIAALRTADGDSALYQVQQVRA